VDQNARVEEFVTLYMKNSRRIHGFVRALVPHHPDAEDVFQDVSRTLWAKFYQFESGTNFVVWAFSIARFKVMEYRKRRARHPASLSDAAFELIAEEVIGSADEDIRIAMLANCLRKLGHKDRELIEARYRHGHTTRAVARSSNQSIDAIYRALRRIHKALFNCIQQQLVQER
jgi:RNA polymerase sigma-70 factor (ECF subfamily)